MRNTIDPNHPAVINVPVLGEGRRRRPDAWALEPGRVRIGRAGPLQKWRHGPSMVATCRRPLAVRLGAVAGHGVGAKALVVERRRQETVGGLLGLGLVHGDDI